MTNLNPDSDRYLSQLAEQTEPPAGDDYLITDDVSEAELARRTKKVRVDRLAQSVRGEVPAPSNSAPGNTPGSPSAGTTTEYARGDHDHGVEGGGGGGGDVTTAQFTEEQRVRAAGDDLQSVVVSSAADLRTTLTAQASSDQPLEIYFSAEVVDSGTTYAHGLVAYVAPRSRAIESRFTLPAGTAGLNQSQVDARVRLGLDTIPEFVQSLTVWPPGVPTLADLLTTTFWVIMGEYRDGVPALTRKLATFIRSADQTTADEVGSPISWDVRNANNVIGRFVQLPQLTQADLDAVGVRSADKGVNMAFSTLAADNTVLGQHQLPFWIGVGPQYDLGATAAQLSLEVARRLSGDKIDYRVVADGAALRTALTAHASDDNALLLRMGSAIDETIDGVRYQYPANQLVYFAERLTNPHFPWFTLPVEFTTQQLAELIDVRISPIALVPSAATLVGPYDVAYDSPTILGPTVWAELSVGGQVPARQQLVSGGGTRRFSLTTQQATAVANNLTGNTIDVRVNLYTAASGGTLLATLHRNLTALPPSSAGGGLSQAQVDARIATYARISPTGQIADAQIPAGITRDSELAAVRAIADAATTPAEATTIANARVAAGVQGWAQTGDSSIIPQGKVAATVQTLTSAATITWDTSKGLIANLTLGHNTVITPTGGRDGDTAILRVKQDATGSRTLAFAAGVVLGGRTPSVASAASAATEVLLHRIGNDWKYEGSVEDV